MLQNSIEQAKYTSLYDEYITTYHPLHPTKHYILTNLTFKLFLKDKLFFTYLNSASLSENLYTHL